MNNLPNKMPFIFTISGMIAIIILSLFQVRYVTGGPLFLSILIIAIYFLWVIIESSVAYRDTQAEETKKDRFSCELYMTARGLVLFFALIVPPSSDKHMAQLLTGMIVFVMGVALRLSAVKTLGKYYSHRVRIHQGHQIIDNGPYKFIRHPAYTGMIIAHSGFLIFFFNWLCALFFFGFLIPCIIYRIITEEKTMMEVDEYRKYSYSRKRLVPLVW